MTNLSNKEQLAQWDAVNGIQTLIDKLGWGHDGIIVAAYSSIKGNVCISYLDVYGGSHNVECEAAPLSQWLVKQYGQSRLQFLQLLDKKVQQNKEKQQENI